MHDRHRGRRHGWRQVGLRDDGYRDGMGGSCAPVA